ncbi:MAG: hypothetical protein QOK35_2506 [Pseudonocardiales bacterium]|nr:hypothetical protein [Pseudonocardiales bacterium]
MTGLRAPVVAGVAGGVGVTTLAVALRAHDAGRGAADTADILACRGTLDSLRRAAAVLERPGGAPVGPPPVLAVTLDGPRLPRGPVRARLEVLEAAVCAVVLLPHVPRWRTTADPLPEVGQLLVEPAERLPRPLRAYAAALRELAAAVAASGRLHAGFGPARGAGTAAFDPVRGAVAAGFDPVRGVRVAGPAPGQGNVRPPTGAAPRVVGAFRPVVGSVVRAAPAPGPALPDPAVRGRAEPVRRARGVRIVPASRPRVSAERIEQVG